MFQYFLTFVHLNLYCCAFCCKHLKVQILLHWSPRALSSLNFRQNSRSSEGMNPREGFSGSWTWTDWPWTWTTTACSWTESLQCTKPSWRNSRSKWRTWRRNVKVSKMQKQEMILWVEFTLQIALLMFHVAFWWLKLLMCCEDSTWMLKVELF